jgi:N-acetyl-gamma-glutamyl-phosphate reductase
MKKIGIIGGTGYTGVELLKILKNHPEIAKISIAANSTANKDLYEVLPELVSIVDDIKIQTVEELLENNYDVIFLALPHAEAHNLVPMLLNRDTLIIDLGGDFRLSYCDDYKKWYGFEHLHQNLLDSKTYGLAEFVISYNFKLIANPGCYPTSILLAVIPIIKLMNNNIESINTVSYSGLSGAGKSLRPDLLLSEMYGNVKAYNILKHRHEIEIYQQMNKYGYNKQFSFIPHLLPVMRGIYSTTIITLKNKVNKQDIINFYKEIYKDEIFVRVRNNVPELKWVVNTNFCDIGIEVRDNVIVINSAIDNLLKGASGQAIQNMNKYFGFNQTLGLL